MPSILSNLSAQQLRKAASIREKIDELEKQMDSIVGTTSSSPKVAPVPKVAAKPAPKRRFSAATRAAMAKRLKERWAKRKAAGKKAL